jgi:hypothetical protein
MNDLSCKITITFNGPDLEIEEQEQEAQLLLEQLANIDEIESVNRASDPNVPKQSKAFGGVLLGLLTVQVNVSNAKKLLVFLGDRLSGKVIELEVEANGKKLKVKAHSQEELAMAIEEAQKFIGS